ncbi:MAG: hypothetical protein M1830_007951 [Pleopsidium flavum]|nr:MAG: hypothetical protein M1830_007951 [Pleopsidium flavum]
MDAHSVRHDEKLDVLVGSEFLSVASDGEVAPASQSRPNASHDSCQSIRTAVVVDPENENNKKTVESDIQRTPRGTCYSFTSNQLHENAYNAEPLTISALSNNLQEGDVVELTPVGSESVQRGPNYKVIRLNNPRSLQPLARKPGQGEDLKEGESFDADAGAGQISRTGTSYSLTHDQLCESFIESDTRVVRRDLKPTITTTTNSDCQVTFGPLLEPVGVLFTFYFPDLDASRMIPVLRDSEEYKKDPKLFVQQKAPVIKESIKNQMSEEPRDPKDEWWHILVEVREEAKKRRADEAVLKALREGFENCEGFTKLAARMVGNAALGNREAVEDHELSSSRSSQKWIATSKTLENDECTQGKGKARLSMLEEGAKGPRKKKNKTKSGKRHTDAVVTLDDFNEHRKSQPGQSSKGETSAPFAFDFETESIKDRMSHGKPRAPDHDDAPLTVDGNDDSKSQRKRHSKGAKSMTLTGYEITSTDSNRDAAVERLKKEALPMSLEDARGKRTTLRKERSDSVQFLRQRTFSRGSSVSGSRPPSPLQRDPALKLDVGLLEDVEEVPNPTKAGFSGLTLGVAATAEVSSADEGDWQTVNNQKHKKQTNMATAKDMYGTALRNTSPEISSTEIVATSSDRDSTPLSSMVSPTSSSVTVQAPAVDLVASSTKSAGISTISELRVSESATSDEHGENLHVQNLKNCEVTTAGEAFMSTQKRTSDHERIAFAAKPVSGLSEKEGTLDKAEELRKVTNAWKDQSDDEFEDTTDRQRLLRDPLFHSENNEAYVFRDRLFLVPPQLESEENIRTGTCFPHIQIFLGNPYTGELPEQIRRDPATPPLICKCSLNNGNHALVAYEPSIHRMVIHAMLNPRPDHRNNPFHPDYLPPFKQAEYQAYEQAGYPVYRFDRVTFECNLSTCRKDLKDHVRSTVLCNGCGPYSDVRYCSKEHLFEDCKTHWQLCGLTPPRIVWDEWTMPSRYRRRYPAIKDRRGRTTPERQRQQAYSIHHNSSDYVIFNDWRDEEVTGEKCRATGKPILFLIFRKNDPMKDTFNRLLNIAFLDHYHADVIIYLYRIIRRACRQQGKWTNQLNHQLCHQLFHEFYYDPRHLVSERNDCRGDWDGVADENCGNLCKRELAHNGTGASQFCTAMEAKHWILRVWRRQHPEKVWVQRMIGVGFPGVPEEKQRLYKAGEGWEGWGVEKDEVCD